MPANLKILEPYRPAERTRVPLEQIGDWETLVIEAKYSQKELSNVCGYSVRHLQRFVLEKYKKTLSAFISGIRLQKAYILLKSGFSIKETALGLGYKQVSHFCRCFKRHFDATASCVLARSVRHGDAEQAGGNQLQLELFQPRKPVQAKRGRRQGVARGRPGRVGG